MSRALIGVAGRLLDRVWGARQHAIAVVTLLCVATACSAPAKRATPPNPLRLQLEREVAALASDQPLELRFNPAPCDCPAFELKLPSGWLRAELYANAAAEPLGGLLRWLGDQPAERWPIAVRLRGAVDRDIARTGQGAYALRIDVSEIVSPQPPPTPPWPATAPPEDPGAGGVEGEGDGDASAGPTSATCAAVAPLGKTRRSMPSPDQPPAS